MICWLWLALTVEYNDELSPLSTVPVILEADNFLKYKQKSMIQGDTVP